MPIMYQATVLETNHTAGNNTGEVSVFWNSCPSGIGEERANKQ